MKAIEFWARKFAGADKGSIDMAVVEAFQEGFKLAQSHSAHMMLSISPARGQQLAILIMGIGSASVDPVTGEHLTLKEDREDASSNR